MISKLLKNILGSRNDRLLKQYRQMVAKINSLESGVEKLTDEELRARTESFRQRYAAGETLNDLLPEAFAVVREGGKRVLQMRHFDEQLIGGMTLHSGKIAEMRTGEGKTLMATLYNRMPMEDFSFNPASGFNQHPGVGSGGAGDGGTGDRGARHRGSGVCRRFPRGTELRLWW